MFRTTLKRITKSGISNFKRNGIVSFASVLVMSITLLIALSLVFLQAVLHHSLSEIQQRVDITMYFTVDADNEKITSIKESLEKLPEVSSVVYVSEEEALVQFKERHKDDYLTLQALEELGENPLGSSLKIQAKEASQYESIARFIEGEEGLGGTDIDNIDSVNYEENKVAIERLSTVIDGAKKLGFLVTLIFAVLSIVITFNTIRLTIFIAREEINVMQLVGASRAHVQGPFMIEGMIAGIVAGISSLVVFFPITYWLGKTLTQFLGIDLFAYYIDNFLELLLIILVSGIIMGALSSFLAIRKYLRD